MCAVHVCVCVCVCVCACVCLCVYVHACVCMHVRACCICMCECVIVSACVHACHAYITSLHSSSSMFTGLQVYMIIRIGVRHVGSLNGCEASGTYVYSPPARC